MFSFQEVKGLCSDLRAHKRISSSDLKQLPDEAAAGLLSELATPLQAFELPVMNLAKIDWDSINVSLQRIEVCL